jgi:hypothetical protein
MQAGAPTEAKRRCLVADRLAAEVGPGATDLSELVDITTCPSLLRMEAVTAGTG